MQNRHAVDLGNCLGQRRRLVESARPQPAPMQRHGQQRLGALVSIYYEPEEYRVPVTVYYGHGHPTPPAEVQRVVEAAKAVEYAVYAADMIGKGSLANRALLDTFFCHSGINGL